MRQETLAKEMSEKAGATLQALRKEYVDRRKERGTWQKQREQLAAEQKAVEEEMDRFIALHEGEINDLLTEYWTMRKQAGECSSFFLSRE